MEYEEKCKNFIDLNKIFDAPKIIGIIDATKNWSGVEGIIDPYTDIVNAIRLLPSTSMNNHLITNKRMSMVWEKLDITNRPIYIDIITFFSKTSNSKNNIFRTSPNVPNDTVLLVSDHNEIVVINTEPNR